MKRFFVNRLERLSRLDWQCHGHKKEEKSVPTCAIGDNAMSEIAPLCPPHCQPDDLAKSIY